MFQRDIQQYKHEVQIRVHDDKSGLYIHVRAADTIYVGSDLQYFKLFQALLKN